MTDMTVYEGDLATEPFVYVGFWRRLAAIGIDVILFNVIKWPALLALLVPVIIVLIQQNLIGLSLLLLQKYIAMWPYVLFVDGIVSTIGLWLYFALQEASKHQATFGKRLMGIKVVNREGQRLSFANATGRFFARWYSNASIFMIRYLTVNSNSRKQARHDVIAGTFVVKSV